MNQNKHSGKTFPSVLIKILNVLLTDIDHSWSKMPKRRVIAFLGDVKRKMKCLSLVLPPVLLLCLSVSPCLSENKLFLHRVVSLKLHGCPQPPPCSSSAYSPNYHSSRSKSLSCEPFNIRNCLCICQFGTPRNSRS